jgi:uncharacterized protein (TIGR03435 family)
VRHIVRDETGLNGGYDIDLSYGGSKPVTEASLSLLLQEQLGLRLTPREELVDVLVVTGITQPRID